MHDVSIVAFEEINTGCLGTSIIPWYFRLNESSES